MINHRLILVFIANLLITPKTFSQESKGKSTGYLSESYGDTTTLGNTLNSKTLTDFPIGKVIDNVNLKIKK